VTSRGELRGEPLVSIGIPAYNRPTELERAVRSAIDQDYPRIEVLISDDASPDSSVATLGKRLESGSDRVRFVRQPVNLGHDRNYQWVLEAVQGDYFMWLSDDDWLDPTYVSSCVRALQDEPGTVLVCGRAHCYSDGGVNRVLSERPTNLTSGRAGLRLVSYFGSVSLNGPLFGVARRGDVLEIGFPDVVGGDWLLVAGLAARGRIRTLPDVHIHRSLTGLGSDPDRLAEAFGMRGFVARNHHVLLAGRVFGAIVMGRLGTPLTGRVARLTVGAVAAAEVLIRFPGFRLVRDLIGDSQAARVEEWVRRNWRRNG
jgi:glycosyltransferase involved in cell wall biosynthesis